MKPVLSVCRKGIRGFTLVETLMAVSVMGFATVGIVAFMRTGLMMYYADRARLTINRDMRVFTSRLATDAVAANFFCIYPDFSTRSTGSGSLAVDAAVADGQVGDFLVLVYTDPSSTSQGISMITRIVGYYREVNDTALNSGPVRRFSIDLSASPVNISSAPMYTILTNAVTGSASSYPIVEQLAQGLATNATGSTPAPALFYNRQNRSVMVNTQISASLTERGTTSRTGNTFNFTVSPRG